MKQYIVKIPIYAVVNRQGKKVLQRKSNIKCINCHGTRLYTASDTPTASDEAYCAVCKWRGLLETFEQ